MRYIRLFLPMLVSVMTVLGASAALTGDWQVYPTYANAPVRAVTTPGKVYFASYPHSYTPSSTYMSSPVKALFSYDIEGEEITPLSGRNKLSEEYILDFAYNPVNGYLLVIYENFNIDLLFDDGSVRNISTLMTASLPGEKTVNCITFYPAENQIFIATGFGYVCIDDSECEVSESRNYGTPLACASRVGNRFIALTKDKAYIAGFDTPRLSLADYSTVASLNGYTGIFPLSENEAFGYVGKAPGNCSFYWVDFVPSVPEVASTEPALNEWCSDIQIIGNNVVVPVWSRIYKLGAGRKTEMAYLDSSCKGKIATGSDLKKIYTFTDTDGMSIWNVDPSTRDVTLAASGIRPNSPAANFSYNMVYHPDYGLLVGSIGPEGVFKQDFSPAFKNQISAFKDGFWDEHSLYFTNPDRASIADRALGLAVDPNDRKYVYRGSTFNGLVRYNLEDPRDILHLSRTTDEDANNPGFVGIVGPNPLWDRLCRFNQPQFDTSGNLYVSFNTGDATGLHFGLWRWTAEDRKASVDASRYRPMEFIGLKNIGGSNEDFFLVLGHSSSKGKIIAYVPNGDEKRQIVIFDDNGTFTDTSDDKILTITSGYDQDGGTVAIDNINCFFEDPSTGLVWIGSDAGVYTLKVADQNSSTGSFSRVKVARNDGTSLADYLLNEVKVNHITADDEGRKWFSTEAGLVCTGNDGRRILGEFTERNSYIPSSNVISSAYNPVRKSIMVSTDRGLAEFTPSGGFSSEEGSYTVRAYPSPVEPGYYGYVTIDGLPDNSLVKIADSNGGLVCELGRAESGSIQWDVTNLEHKRVATGVYFILVSPPEGSSSSSSVGKIMVLN